MQKIQQVFLKQSHKLVLNNRKSQLNHGSPSAAGLQYEGLQCLLHNTIQEGSNRQANRHQLFCTIIFSASVGVSCENYTGFQNTLLL